MNSRYKINAKKQCINLFYEQKEVKMGCDREKSKLNYILYHPLLWAARHHHLKKVNLFMAERMPSIAKLKTNFELTLKKKWAAFS